ncbi:MAG: hypothetical protein DMG65_17570 [Candidatus Angelobacter sp. Gp1-AA117]|nr:MAG: hypothetical protein DMG65_17570 [Candidatus Angelobacter sp. Gp1-AA117]
MNARQKVVEYSGVGGIAQNSAGSDLLNGTRRRSAAQTQRGIENHCRLRLQFGNFHAHKQRRNILGIPQQSCFCFLLRTINIELQEMWNKRGARFGFPGGGRNRGAEGNCNCERQEQSACRG